jgi:2-methylcitrate dehydratase PrpD
MAERLALTLSEWSGALRWGDLTTEHQTAVRLWLLDTLGVILAAVDEPPGRAVLAVATRQGGRPEASVVGQAGRLPATWAALAHGTLAHALDFDDTLPAPVVHPGSLVVPTALAVSEAAGTDGEAVLAAIAGGYELAARLGAPAGRRLHARGFHASGVVGPLVAAAVAAKLAGLSPRQTAEAMGLAGSMAGGLLEFLADGSWSKRLHPGWAGHGGVVASQLAAAGFPGPVSVVEGRHGLYAAFLGGAEADDLAAVTRGLGREWASRAVLPKLYPCAHVIHPFLDAALALRSRHALAPDAIATVRCHVASWQVPIVCEPRASRIAPATEYQARASLPFTLAAALVDGRVDLDTFGEGSIRRADLLAMAARVGHAEAADVAGDFAGAVTLETRDGRTLAAESAGHGAVTAERLRAKFAATAGRLLPAPAVARLAAAVDALPSGTPGALMALCQR